MCWPHKLQPTNGHLQAVALVLIKTGKIMWLLNCISSARSIAFGTDQKYKIILKKCQIAAVDSEYFNLFPLDAVCSLLFDFIKKMHVNVYNSKWELFNILW